MICFGNFNNILGFLIFLKFLSEFEICFNFLTEIWVEVTGLQN